MQGYLTKGKELLKLVVNNGFEAFFVGEVVRNTIINIEFKKIDIITNATIEQLKEIFNNNGNLPYDETPDAKGLKIEYSDYSFYFQSFNAASNNLQVDSRSTLTRHYSKNLLDDLSTKNFTINAIAMSLNGKITDAFNGCDDIKAKKIRSIGNPKQKFASDPLDILRAIELVSELKFKISDKTYSAMKKRAKMLSSVDKTLLIEKIKDILDKPYAKLALKQLANANLYKYLPSLNKGMKRLCTHYHKIDIEELLLMSFVLNEKQDFDYDPAIKNVETFRKIYNLAIANKKAKYDSLTLFSNGLDVCLEANYINYLIGKTSLKTKIIKKEFENLPIQKVCDLKYKGDEILRITGINDTKFINDIMDEVCLNVLNGVLENNFEAIQSYVLKALTARGVQFDLSKELSVDDLNQENYNNLESRPIIPNNVLNSDERNVDLQIKESINEDNYTSHRLKILEERLDEQDRLLKEKSERLKEIEKQKVLESTSKIVNNAMDFVKKDSQVSSMIKDLNEFEMDFRSFIVDYLEKEKQNEKD